MDFLSELNKYKLHSGKSIDEDCIEKALIEHLKSLGYIYRDDIKSYDKLKYNFRENIEKLNNYKFDNDEFDLWWTQFDSGDVYTRFIRIKSNPYVVRDKKTNRAIRTLIYFDTKNSDINNFEIINQMWVLDKNNNKNRFDINILINGIPIVHIELKKESIDLKQACSQIVNYKKKEAISNFLDFTKIFIYSNGTNTSYFVNNNTSENKNNNSAFIWANKNNENLNELLEFSDHFLKRDFLIDFISNYFVYDDEKEIVKIFRPYQYHACKEILNKINSDDEKKSGYIWHATGSGKTMTSFKICEILAKTNSNVDLTVFLIDRIDLNDQTFKNFKRFTTDKNLIKNATNSTNLMNLLINKDSERKIIITTIQKLNSLLKDINHLNVEKIANKKIVFIIDECHRSQVGTMRDNIDNFFPNIINFAFTGTPIFDLNAKNGNTTENIFGPLIHKYTSYNAILDGNVLPITYTHSESIKTNNDEEFDDDQSENMANDKKIIIDYGRIDEVVKYVNNEYDKLTRNKHFNAMFACSSIPEAQCYFKQFKNNTNLRIGIIFSINKSDYSKNQKIYQEAQEFMLKRIKEYNSTWDLTRLDAYKRSIQEDFSDDNKRKYDLLIVVSMLLTGFDSPITNTLFLDKKLRYQGLVQAISRTNRLYRGKESGYVVSFKTNIETVEEAFALYTNGGVSTPDDMWRLETYETIKDEFHNAINHLLNAFPTISFAADLKLDGEKYNFLNLFREVVKLYNKIKPLPDFNWDDFKIDEREFNAYRGISKSLMESNSTNNELLYEYNEYQINDLDTIEINGEYLEKLLNIIKTFNTKDIPENIEEYDEYKKLKDTITNNSKNEEQKELLLDFIKQKELFYSKTWDDIYTLWNRYINDMILKTTDKVITKWKTSKDAINNLIEQFELKHHLDESYIENTLYDFIDNPYEDYKYEDVKKTIEKLSRLKYIKDSINL